RRGQSVSGGTRPALARLCPASAGLRRFGRGRELARHARRHLAFVRRSAHAGARPADPGRPFAGRHDRSRDGGNRTARSRTPRSNRPGRAVARRAPDTRPLLEIAARIAGLLFHNPEFGERMMTAGADFDDPKFLEAFIIRNTRQLAMAGKMLFPIPDRGLDERLYRIRAKTVLIWGESDRVIPATYGNAFCRGIAGAELVQIPAAAHMVIVEQPEAVVAALASLE